MEARNQRVDDLLLEIDQSIAASRHAMRSFFFSYDGSYCSSCKVQYDWCRDTQTQNKRVNNRNYELDLKTIEAATMKLVLSLLLLGLGVELIPLRSLSNKDNDGNKNVTNLHIWQWKTVALQALHALHVHFSFLHVVDPSRTWNYLFCSCVDDGSTWQQIFNFVFLSRKRLFQFNFVSPFYNAKPK